MWVLSKYGNLPGAMLSGGFGVATGLQHAAKKKGKSGEGNERKETLGVRETAPKKRSDMTETGNQWRDRNKQSQQVADR